MEIVCLDLEGVLVPEIWINFAQRTGIEALKKTTRDVPVYEDLMDERLGHLKANNLGLSDIQEVIAQMQPLDGAAEFLDDLRQQYQVIILSDTFYEFAQPLMAKLGWPTLFCHHLEVTSGAVSGYTIRQADPKRSAVKALRMLNMPIAAAGDSFNDLSMLEEADAGVFFRAPDNITSQYTQFPAVQTYPELGAALAKAFNAAK